MKGKKNWIKDSIQRPGALRAKAKRAGMTTRAYAEMHQHDSGLTGQQSREALTLMGMRKK